MTSIKEWFKQYELWFFRAMGFLNWLCPNVINIKHENLFKTKQQSLLQQPSYTLVTAYKWWKEARQLHRTMGFCFYSMLIINIKARCAY
jgi:hypothetical protein